MTTLIKLSYIAGLRPIVARELALQPSLTVVAGGDEELYLEPSADLGAVRALRSVSNAYLVRRGATLNPHYLTRHKSILGDLITQALAQGSETFRTFKLSCAGSGSPEMTEIRRYVADTFKLIEDESDADLKLHIGKSGEIWEAGVALTERPLSLRAYRVANIEGGLNPTIAYAMNTLADIQSATSYLNIFSGSGTLLIEAGLSNPKLRLVGFDSDGKTNSLAIRNVREAGLIKSIQIKTADIHDRPELGQFDVITSDLPFGMLVGKYDDLQELYKVFIEHCATALNPDGRLVVYTTEHELLRPVLEQSKFAIVETLELKLSTNIGGYIHPQIFVCKLTT